MPRTWNYRIVQHADHLALHEVHYEDGEPTNMSVEPTTFVAHLEDGPEDIVSALERALSDAKERGLFVPPEAWGAPWEPLSAAS